MKSQPRVLILHTGGTFAMVLSPEKNASKQNKGVLNTLLAHIPELSRIAEINLESISNIDSSDVDIRLWQKLARVIYENWDSFDGVVIIHGTDTMAYTACALSFLLAGLTKPVVLTGAQRPLSELRTDARANLIDSVELATSGIPEVMVCFDSVIYRGTRVTKRSSEHMHAFTSLHCPPLGQFGVHFTVNHALVKPPVAFAQRHKPSLDLRLSERVFVLDVIPPTPMNDAVTEALLNHYKGIILRGFGVGNLPLKNQSWLKMAEAAKERSIPLVIGSQCQTGTINLQTYENGRKFARRGAMSGHNMGLECMALKLMVMIGREIPFESRHEFFATPLASECGEVSQK